MRLAAALLALAAALPAAVSAFAQPLTLHDDRGQNVTLPAPPQRVVSLLPSLTETVCALGECSRLVGTDRYSDWPAEVQRLPKLGGLDDAQIERIVALRPDLVLAAPSHRLVERLQSLGLAVLVLDSRTHADALRSIELLGRAFRKPDAAHALAAGVERELQAAAAHVPPARRGQRVYFEVDDGPYAAGPASFLGETLTRLGMANIIPVAMGPFPRLNPEFVVRAQPDIVMGGSRALGEMPLRPGWNALLALQRHQTCAFAREQSDVLVRPGPRLGQAALLLADCVAALSVAGSADRIAAVPVTGSAGR
jgi:iron complex transport system substrate-binding protein